MIVLDTHAWLWWVSDPVRLSAGAANAITGSDVVGVSTISCWEVAMLVERGRIAIDRSIGDWVRSALAADPRVRALPPTPDIAVAAALLGQDGVHGDPADRFILATARAAGGLLVTRDAALRAADPAGTVW